jgi:hypothetical protein
VGPQHHAAMQVHLHYFESIIFFFFASNVIPVTGKNPAAPKIQGGFSMLAFVCVCVCVWVCVV